MSTFEIPSRPDASKVLFDLLSRVRRLESIPQYPPYRIKLFADRDALDGNLPNSAIIVSTGNGKFIHVVEEGLDLSFLQWAYIYVSTPGSDDLEVMMHNITQGVDMLLAPLTISAGDYSSYPAAANIDLDNCQVNVDDRIRIDVDADGGGDAEGLGIGFNFKLYG